MGGHGPVSLLCQSCHHCSMNPHRREVRQLHDGLRVLTVLVERTIIAHVKATPDGPNKERKLVQLSSELDNAELSVLSDVFKILFAITMSWHDNEEDFTQAEREICVKLSHLLRILISYLHQGRDATRENTLQYVSQCVCVMALWA